MRALALVCTLNASPAPSSSQYLAEQVMTQFARLDVPGEIVRVAVLPAAEASTPRDKPRLHAEPIMTGPSSRTSGPEPASSM